MHGRPQLIRRRKSLRVPFLPGPHIHLADLVTIGRVGILDRELLRIRLGLSQPFGRCHPLGLGLNHADLPIAVHQHIVGDLWTRTATTRLDPPHGDRELPQDLGPIDYTPPARREFRIDVFRPGFRFVHNGYRTIFRKSENAYTLPRVF